MGAVSVGGAALAHGYDLSALRAGNDTAFLA